jgi:hypothetical protein
MVRVAKSILEKVITHLLWGTPPPRGRRARTKGPNTTPGGARPPQCQDYDRAPPAPPAVSRFDT